MIGGKTRTKVRRKGLLLCKKPHQIEDDPSPLGPVSPAEERTASALHPMRLSVY